MSVWPVEGGRYGLDATYHGATGLERAEAQLRRLRAAGLIASLRQELNDCWTLRLGPLGHSAAWMAIEAFLGPPRPDAEAESRRPRQLGAPPRPSR